VTAWQEKYYMIGNKAYVVVVDYKNGYNYEAFRDRYSEVLDRYDYIVGDWGYNQLRLKGFFREDNPKATKETSIATLQDYLNEYCNFGCAYFVVEKVNHPPADGEIINEPAQPAVQAPAGGGSTDGDAALPMRYNRTGVAVRMTAADRSYAEDYALERRRAAAREAEGGEGAWGAYGRGREHGVRESTVREHVGRETGDLDFAAGESGARNSEIAPSGAFVSSNGGKPEARPVGREAGGAGGHERARNRDAVGAVGHSYDSHRHERDKPREKPGARGSNGLAGAEGPGAEFGAPAARTTGAPGRPDGGFGEAKGPFSRHSTGQAGYYSNQRPSQRPAHPKYTKADRLFPHARRKHGSEPGRGPGKPL